MRSSVLDGIPDWLCKWAALICEFVEFEQSEYAKIQDGKLSRIDISIELKNLRDSKLSNIAITINKVARILKLMKTDDPPIRKMTGQEVFHALWGAQESLKHQLVEVLSNIEESDQVQHCFEFIKNADEEEEDEAKMLIDEKNSDDLCVFKDKKIDYDRKNEQIRNIFFFIS